MEYIEWYGAELEHPTEGANNADATERSTIEDARDSDARKLARGIQLIAMSVLEKSYAIFQSAVKSQQ